MDSIVKPKVGSIKDRMDMPHKKKHPCLVEWRQLILYCAYFMVIPLESQTFEIQSETKSFSCDETIVTLRRGD